MKILLLLLLSFPASAEIDENSTQHHIETDFAKINYRSNNLLLLQRIINELRIIRCQTEVSNFCDKINDKVYADQEIKEGK